MAETERKPRGMAVVEDRSRAERAVMTRRQLLSGTGQIALLAMMLPLACAPVANKPWADGTFWDDGQGWTA